MNEDDKPTAAVIDLEKERLKAKHTPVIATKYSMGCRHKHTVVDQRARTVECDDCGASLDPLQVLWDLACDHSRLLAEFRHTERKLKRAREDLEETLRLERNAKARLANARRKLRN